LKRKPARAAILAVQHHFAVDAIGWWRHQGSSR
jgi:hypothetical protein